AQVQHNSRGAKRNPFRVYKIYSVAAFLITIGIFQLGILKGFCIDLVDSVPVPNFMSMLIALVCILLLVFTELFNQYPVNWTLGIVAVESVTLCTISSKWNNLPFWYAINILAIVLLLNIVFHLLGAFLPLMLLPGYYSMIFITIVFIIVYIFLSVVLFILSNLNLMVIIDLW
ncbi:hypothetical protein KR093_009676, partial [Drosophila rubida]